MYVMYVCMYVCMHVRMYACSLVCRWVKIGRGHSRVIIGQELNTIASMQSCKWTSQPIQTNYTYKQYQVSKQYGGEIKFNSLQN